MDTSIFFLVGGVIVGIAASLLMLGYGRVMGASGIIFGALVAPEKIKRCGVGYFYLE